MKKTLLFACLFLNLGATGAFARAPAVDNFIGVEPANYNPRAPSSEKAYNFEKGSGLQEGQQSQFQAPSKNQSISGFWGYVLFTLILGAPFLLWGLMMKKLELEKPDNVVTLETKKENEIKQAS